MRGTLLLIVLFQIVLVNNLASKNNDTTTWDIRKLESFVLRHSGQPGNTVGLIVAMLLQEDIEVNCFDVDLAPDILNDEPTIKCVYLYPNLNEMKDGEEYYRLKLMLDKAYLYPISDFSDLIEDGMTTQEILVAIGGALPYSKIIIESMIRGEELDYLGCNSLYLWKAKTVIEQCFNNNSTLKVSEIYRILNNNNIEIKDVNVNQTSPWIDSEGKSYLRDLLLYSNKGDNMIIGQSRYRIKIELNYVGKEKDTLHFWNKISEKYLVDDFVKETKEMTATNVTFSILKME